MILTSTDAEMFHVFCGRLAELAIIGARHGLGHKPNYIWEPLIRNVAESGLDTYKEGRELGFESRIAFRRSRREMVRRAVELVGD